MWQPSVKGNKCIPDRTALSPVTQPPTDPVVSASRNSPKAAHVGEDWAGEGCCQGGVEVGPDRVLRAHDRAHHQDTGQVVRIGTPEGVQHVGHIFHN